MRKIDTACEKIRDSKHLKDILEIILAVGNYMNDSNKQANGFKLGSLQRLAFTKDEKNTMTFLHYVEKIVRTSFPHLEEFCDDLKDAIEVSKLNIDQLKSDCEEFMQMVKNVQTSVDIGNLSDSSKFHPQDKILETILPVLPEARRKREYLNDQLITTTTQFNKLMKYFGEDPSDATASSTFFSKFASFVFEFQKAHKENLVREQESRAYEARKRLHEAPKKSSQLESGALSASGSGSPTSDGNGSSVMDSLLEKLKAAGPSGDARSARRRAAARRNMAEHRRALLSQGKISNDELLSDSSLGTGDADIIEISSQSTPNAESNNEEEEVQTKKEPAEENDPIVASDEEKKSELERSGTTMSESAIPSRNSIVEDNNEAEDDDVGGRARKLLQELRSGNSEYSSGAALRLSGSLGSSTSTSKLAERRSRKAQQLKNRSQGINEVLSPKGDNKT